MTHTSPTRRGSGFARLIRRSRTGPDADERGQSLVEFAFVLPVFILILIVVMDFGWAFFNRMTVMNATREGVRIGVTYRNQDLDNPELTGGQIQDLVRQQVVSNSSNLVETADVSVTCYTAGTSTAIDCGAAERLDRMEVHTQYTHQPLFPIIFGSEITTTSSVYLTME